MASCKNDFLCTLVNQLIIKIILSVFSPPTIVDKSPWGSNAVFIIFCNVWVPSYYRATLQFSLPSPNTKSRLGKNLDVHMSNGVYGVRGGAGHLWIGKCPRNAKVCTPRLLFKIVGILLIPRRKLYLSPTTKANRQIFFWF